MRLALSLALTAAAVMSHPGTALAAEDPGDDVSVARDLTAVLALQGSPCGHVVSASQLGQDDYIASCENGNRYRVCVNADGRVVVQTID